MQLNISKANKILKWYPKLSIDKSVKETVDWYKYVYLYGSKKAEEITSKQIENYMDEI